MSNDKIEKFTITGKLYWTALHTPNTQGEYPSNKYQADIALDETSKKLLIAKGVKVNKNNGKDKGGIKNRNDDRGDFVTATSNYAPLIVDAKKQTIGKDVSVGNGSLANILLHTYESRNGVSVGLDAVQVVELVSYKSKNVTDVFDAVDGFTNTDVDAFEESNEQPTVKVSGNPF